MNAFDLKAALLARHAQHPAIIHFPIALFITSVLFDLLAVWRKNRGWGAVGYYNLLAAASTVPMAVASGLTAWQWQLEGITMKGNLLLHVVFALSSSAMIWALCGWRVWQRRSAGEVPGRIYLGLALGTGVLIALAGHFGGIVSGVEAAAM